MTKFSLLKNITTLILLSVLYSCSESESDNISTPSAILTPNPEEEFMLSSSIIERGISIDNTTLETGTLTPNGLITFEVVNEKVTGYLNSGFQIDLKVSDSYAGSYIQILNADGTVSKNYYRVPKKGINGFKKLKFNTLKTLKQKSLIGNEMDTEFNETIDVAFNSTIPAGTFCYWICPYDDDGNIGNPVEVCVEIEAWAGNPALIGTWLFSKVETSFGGKENSIKRGEKSCEEIKNCGINNETYQDCETIESLDFIFSRNGDFSDISETIITDRDTRSADCVITTSKVVTEHSGKWAYNEEEGTLTTVIFNTNKNGGSVVYNRENGNVGIPLKVNFINRNTMTLEVNLNLAFSDDDESKNDFEIYYFAKK